MKRLTTALICAATLSLSGCGYNALQRSDEEVKADWSEVINQYQRRADSHKLPVASDEFRVA